MKIRTYSLFGILVMAASASHLQANGDQQHAHDSPQARKNALVNIVREATEKYRDVIVAENDQYRLMFGCVSGGDSGAMGLHYVKPALIGDDVIDPMNPEIVIYEPLPNGGRKLVGADFLVFKDVWDANHSSPPQLMGQLFHLFEAPNRFGLPAFYTLHVWAWKENTTGTFVNWHSNLSCDAFNGEPGQLQ
jgi:hypothetical protein